MNNTPKLVYVTQIRTTPAKLWEALTNPDFIQQYWFGRRNTSTWQVGDAIESRSPDGELEWKGKVLKSVPEDEVVFTFDHLTDEPPSTVRFKIEPQKDTVQLTITHEDFPEVSTIRDRVKNGWPGIIEGIKSLLETGSAGALPSPCAAK
ncbi:MAG: SRPBCC family protein [Luteolibacter sp.]